MRIDVITLFPEFMAQSAALGVVGRAAERGLLDLHGWNPRDYAEGNYRRWTTVRSAAARAWSC